MVEAGDEETSKNDEELALLELNHDKQSLKLDSTRWARYSETHPAAQVLDILQESTAILRKYSAILLTLALLLAVPLSTLLLSHVLLLLPFMDHMVTSLQWAAEQQLHQAGYRRLAEIIISSVVDIPFSALFSPLLKASVGYVVAATYARKKLEFAEVLDVLHKSWLLLMQTFAWTCSVYFVFASAFAALLLFASKIDTTSTSLFVAAVVGLALAAGMALANVICNLSYVVSVLEGFHGRHALVQSIHLLKGRLDVALLLFLVTNVNGTLLDVLFEFHILRNGDAAIVYDKYWEAPLLVCMHSFVHLFDAIMVSVLYFICKASSETESRLLHPAVEHLSATNDLLAEVRSPLSRGSPLASRSPFAVR